jgi:iron complex outermembrane recepter protein
VLAPSLTYQPTTQTTLTLLALLQKDKSGSSTQFLPWEGTLYPGPNGKVPSSRFVSEPGFDRYDTENKSVTALFQHRFDDVWTVRQNLRYTDSSVDYRSMYPIPFPGPNSPFVDPQRRQIVRAVWVSQPNATTLTSDSSLEAKFRWGAVEQKVLAGVDYVRYRQKSKSGFAYDVTPFDLYAPSYGQPAFLLDAGLNPIGVFPISGIMNGLGIADDPTNRLTQLGTYLQDQVRLGPWIAVAGVRRDWLNNRVEGSADERTEATSRRFGLMYETPFGLTPYVSYSESFEPVSGLNFYNQRFKPFRGEQVELGVKYQPAGPDLVINAAVYDLKEKNQLSSDPNNAQNYIQIDAHSRGLEIEALAKLRSVSLIATYSYTDARVEGGLQDGFRVATVPEHMASLWMKHDFAIGNLKGFSVGGGVRYVGSSWDGFDQLMTPAVTLFDAMFAYDAGTWRWAVNGTNLADKEYVSTCLARGDCFFGNRRAITTSLTYRF